MIMDLLELHARRYVHMEAEFEIDGRPEIWGAERLTGMYDDAWRLGTFLKNNKDDFTNILPQRLNSLAIFWVLICHTECLLWFKGFLQLICEPPGFALAPLIAERRSVKHGTPISKFGCCGM